MTERPEEAISTIRFIHKTRHLPFTDMDIADACGDLLKYLEALEGEKERCARFCEARAERVYAKIRDLSEARGCQPTEGMLATEFVLRDLAERLRNGEQDHE